MAKLEITPEVVKTYRTLYYDYFKPLALENHEEYVRSKMKKKCEEYGWSYRLFESYKSIDFMQRVVFDAQLKREANLKPYPEYAHLDPNNGALRLKCPERTSDPDPLLN